MAGSPATILVDGCAFPAPFGYDVGNHVWYQPLPDGRCRLGMTVVAVALANHRIFAFTPRRVGRVVERGKSAATIESSKWVGPVRVACDGVVTAVNEAAMQRPSLVASDPYGAGWLLELQPTTPLDHLLHGGEMQAAYAEWMRVNDFPGCGTP